MMAVSFISPISSATTDSITDTQAPSWSDNNELSITNVTETNIDLTWPSASDDVGVANYKIYKDSQVLDTVTSSVYSYDVTGLTAGTTYTFKVEAGDDAENWSSDGPSDSVTTAELWLSKESLELNELYNPKELTRAELSKFITLELNLYRDDLDIDIPDVPKHHEYYHYIASAIHANLIITYPDGDFIPDNIITRAEYAVVITRALEYDVSLVETDITDLINHWAGSYAEVALETGLMQLDDDGKFYPSSPMLMDPDSRIINKSNPVDQITWNSSNPNVALVDASGQVKAISSGNANITASSGSGIRKTINITVDLDDNVAPSWTNSNLTASNVTESSLILSWTPAIDNEEIANYKIYQDSETLDTVTSSVYSYDVTGLIAGTTYSFKVEAGDTAENWSSDGPSVSATTTSDTDDDGDNTNDQYDNSDDEDNSSNTEEGTTTNADTGILNKNAVQVTSETADNGQTVTSNVVDGIELSKALEISQKVQIEVSGDVAKVEISADVFSKTTTSNSNAVISIQSGKTSYDLPMNAIEVASLTTNLGISDAKDIKINVTIEKIIGEIADQIKDTSAKMNATSLSEPIHFSVTAEANGKTVDIQDFSNTYVSRTVMLPLVENPEQMTGVLYNSETEEFTFVPTTYENVDGETLVTMRRPGNSIYTVVQHQKTFEDLQGHWAKSDVELLASKFIIQGATETRFSPNDLITRAEFAALLVRALGLSEDQSSANFSDVDLTKWYTGSVGAAAKAKLVSGYEDGSFAPNQDISREQMAVMISNALKFVNKDIDVSDTQENVLKNFKDQQTISDWAQNSIAQAFDAKIIIGMADGMFAPKSEATRGQAARMIKQLLQYIEFMN